MAQHQDSALQLSAIAWRERWTGELRIQLGTKHRVVPFRQGGPVNPADFNMLNAYACRPAEFRFVDQKRRGLRGGLSSLLLRVGCRSAAPLDSGRIQLLLGREDAEALELPEALTELTDRAGATPTVQELQRDLPDSALLGRLVDLGFAKHLEQAEPVLFEDPGIGHLLTGLSDIGELFDGMTLDVGLGMSDPEEELLKQVRELAEQELWADADFRMSEYIGGVDTALLAAWRGWVRLRAPQHPEDERLADALRWIRLADRLPSCVESEQILKLVKERCEMLIENKKREWRCA